MDFVRFGFCLAQGVFYCLAQSTQRTQRRVVDCCAPMNVNHTSYFIFRITMRLYVILYTSYFIRYTSSSYFEKNISINPQNLLII